MESQEFVRNCWYATVWEGEVAAGEIVSRTVIGEPLILFRNEEGSVSALLDRCPHRLAPLSMGEWHDGIVQCGYHGMRFNGDGACLEVPGQSKIPSAACVRSFPVAERYGLLFVWMGDPAESNEDDIYEVKRFGRDGWASLVDGYQLHHTNYLNVVENLMDPAHTTFVHKGTIGNPLAKDEPVEVERGDDYVVAYKWLENSKPSPNDLLAGRFSEDDAVDRAQYFYYYPPTVSRVDICVVDAGNPHDDEHLDKGMRTLSYKFISPETETSSHIFWLHLRNYRIDDSEFETILRANLEKTFWEDNDICAGVQDRQAKFDKRQEVSLAIDRAPRWAVRMIDDQIAAESGEDVVVGV